jgi:N-hydroxyarylamine O-acetyltransferase
VKWNSSAEAVVGDASFDQEGWLARIGYCGGRAPTLETLRGLIFAHAHAISYESLDIMLGRVPKLDVGSLQKKMIDGGRGGYCFEQNMLFRAGLRSLGYRVTSLQGRVVRGLDIDAPRPAIHMLLIVHLPEGDYLADVGFGNLAPTAPLLFKPGVEQETPHETMRFIDVGGELTLQSLLGYIDPSSTRTVVGVLLTIYSVYGLARPAFKPCSLTSPPTLALASLMDCSVD